MCYMRMPGVVRTRLEWRRKSRGRGMDASEATGYGGKCYVMPSVLTSSGGGVDTHKGDTAARARAS